MPMFFNSGVIMFDKKMSILDNLDHVNILDRWIRIEGYSNNESDSLYLAERVKQYFPEYRDQDLLELSDQLKQILVCANMLL